MKKILIALGVVVILVVAGVSFLFSSLDGIVKTAIEKAGSQVAGVKVTVDEVKISLTDGKGSIRGLTVGNPSGFSSPSAFRLGEIAIAIDTGSVTKDPVVIRSVNVTAPEVTFEMDKAGNSNLSALQNNVKAKSGKDTKDSADSKKSGPKLVVDRLDIGKGKIALATPIPGAATEATLGDIHLTGIGKNDNGASYPEIASAVLGALTQSAIRSASSVNLGQMLKGAGDTDPSKLVDGMKGLLSK